VGGGKIALALALALALAGTFREREGGRAEGAREFVNVKVKVNESGKQWAVGAPEARGLGLR